MFLNKAKKVKTYSVAKYYLCLDKKSFIELFQDIEEYLLLFSISIDEYSVNYLGSNEFHLESFNNNVLNIDIKNLESLRLEQNNGLLGVFLTSEFKYLGLNNIFELIFCTPLLGESFFSAFKSISKLLDKKSEVIYGYGRELSSTFDPKTENPIKRSLFGNISVKVDYALDVWLENPSDIKTGSVKGIYALNLITKKSFDNGVFTDFLRLAKPTVDDLENNLKLIKISDDQLMSIRLKMKGISKYIRT